MKGRRMEAEKESSVEYGLSPLTQMCRWFDMKQLIDESMLRQFEIAAYPLRDEQELHVWED